MDIKELKKISKNKLLEFNGVEDAYNEVIENMIREASSTGNTDVVIYKEKYNEVVWYLLLRVLLLDGYKLIYLKYGGQDIKSDFSTADFVDVSWINI